MTLATDEGELLVDEGGMRWLRAAGKLSASRFGAPEPLAFLFKEADGYGFVGRSGTVYRAETCLGPLEEIRRPPEPWVDVAGRGKSLFGVSAFGGLFESEDWGASWRRRDEPFFFAELEVNAAGEIFLLSVPEQWHLLRPDSSELSGVVRAPIGVRSLWSSSGQVFVDSLAGKLKLDRNGFEPAPTAERTKLRDRRIYAGGAEVHSGQALLGEINFVWHQVAAEEELFVPASGSFGGPVEPWSVEPIECESPVVARTAERVAVVCKQPAARGQGKQLVLYQGLLARRKLRRTALKTAPSTGDLLLAVSDSGVVALSGACPDERLSVDCVNRGTVYVVSGERLIPAELATPGVASSLAFATGGTSLYVASLRQKDRHPLIFVRDLESSSLMRVMDLQSALSLPEPSEEAVSAITLRPGAGGLMGVALAMSKRFRTATFTSEGELVAWGQAPPGTVSLDGAGARFLALDESGRTIGESLNGGVTWHESALPRPACEGQNCRPLVACAEVGCLVGQELARRGWTRADGGQEHSSADSLAEEERQAEWQCQLTGAAQPLPDLAWLPDIRDAALGDVAWKGAEVDERTGEVRFLHARRGETRVRREQALAPVADPERFALAVSRQIEGTAAVRYEAPSKESDDPRLRGLEVAWSNWIVGCSGRGQLPFDVPAGGADFHAREGMIGKAFPALLSVAGRGLYLRPARSWSFGDPTYYFEDDQWESLNARRLSDPSLAERTEFVRIGGKHLQLWFSSTGGEVAVAPVAGGSLPVAAARVLTLGGDPRLSESMGFGYRGADIGLGAGFSERNGLGSVLYHLPLTEEGRFGTPVQVPVSLSTSYSAPCSEETRAETPRLVVTTLGKGQPQLQLAFGAEEAISLPLSSAILHGSVGAPCVAAYGGTLAAAEETSAAGRAAVIRKVLLLPRAEGTLGWVFELLASEGSVTVAPFECADVPSESAR